MEGLDPKTIPESILVPMRRCSDFCDFPTAWAIQRDRGPQLAHLPLCSSVPAPNSLAGPAFLCDCGAITTEWKRLRALLPPTPTEGN